MQGAHDKREPYHGDYVVVPGTQFTVRRTAHQNGQSAYYLDGRQTDQKAIYHKLLQEGIDLSHNRFLILQVQCTD